LLHEFDPFDNTIGFFELCAEIARKQQVAFFEQEFVAVYASRILRQQSPGHGFLKIIESLLLIGAGGMKLCGESGQQRGNILGSHTGFFP
jgi:hypothetical protein